MATRLIFNIDLILFYLEMYLPTLGYSPELCTYFDIIVIIICMLLKCKSKSNAICDTCNKCAADRVEGERVWEKSSVIWIFKLIIGSLGVLDTLAGGAVY